MKKTKSMIRFIADGVLLAFVTQSIVDFTFSVFFDYEKPVHPIPILMLGLSYIFFVYTLVKEERSSTIIIGVWVGVLTFFIVTILLFCLFLLFSIVIFPRRELGNADAFLLLVVCGPYLILNLLLRIVTTIVFAIKKL